MTPMYTNVSGEKGENLHSKLNKFIGIFHLAPTQFCNLPGSLIYVYCVCVFLSFKLELFQPNPNEFVLIL